MGGGWPAPGVVSRPADAVRAVYSVPVRLDPKARTTAGVIAGCRRASVWYLHHRSPARPRVIDGQVTVRDVLDLTLAIDHNVVDGGPAARFGAEFRALLESAAAISPSN